MIPYKEFLRLEKEAFANSSITVIPMTGETGPPTSPKTQPTPTNYDKAGITVTLPKYS